MGTAGAQISTGTGSTSGAETADRSRPDSLNLRQVALSWNSDADIPDDRTNDFRLALGKRLTLEFRLAFAEAWHDRAIRHGTTYRFEVVDQSSGEERKISDLDVRRRASARAARVSEEITPDATKKLNAISINTQTR